IVTDAFARFDSNPMVGVKDPLAMWWAFYDLENGMLSSFDELARSKTVGEARQAVSQIYAPGLNMMYANRSGDIGWWAAGKLPIRPNHVDSKMILNGADGKDDILGYHDFSRNPQNVNPTSGVIYTSNNQPADTGIGLIPGYFAPRDRAQRIEKYLYTDKSDWTPDDMKTMLMDNVSPLAKLFQDTTLPSLNSSSSVQKSDIARQALTMFEKWQGNHDVDEVAVTLFYQFKKELCQQILEDELGERNFKTIQSGFLLDRSLWTLLPNSQSPWWNNVKTKDKTETANEIIISSWLASVKHLEEKFGPDITKWQWKHASSLEHVHTLGNMKPLDRIFNVGPFAIPAGEEIINNLGINISKEPFKVTFGPSTRRIIDFGKTDMTFGILPTGQSGNFMDTHYDDQADMYNRGEFRQQFLDRKDVLANAEGRLEFGLKGSE
ncbi:penicillin acylase family protein, partial [bacterium]|nr:penicillin acylase family protein [bacterium]